MTIILITNALFPNVWAIYCTPCISVFSPAYRYTVSEDRMAGQTKPQNMCSPRQFSIVSSNTDQQLGPSFYQL